MSIDPSTTPAKSENVAFRRLAEGEGGVLLHLESGEYHGINEVGCLIWELVDGERTVDGLVAALDKRIEDPPADLAAEVIAFLHRLRERDLVM
jgi:Coenzyme PQQ synthesis protein D (PqqD)